MDPTFLQGRLIGYGGGGRFGMHPALMGRAGIDPMMGMRMGMDPRMGMGMGMGMGMDPMMGMSMSMDPRALTMIGGGGMRCSPWMHEGGGRYLMGGLGGGDGWGPRRVARPRRWLEDDDEWGWDEDEEEDEVLRGIRRRRHMDRLRRDLFSSKFRFCTIVVSSLADFDLHGIMVGTARTGCMGLDEGSEEGEGSRSD